VAGGPPRGGAPRRYLARTFHGAKREAARALAALVRDAERLTPRFSAQGSLEALGREWLAHAAPSFSPRTVEVVRCFLERPIIEHLGAIQAARLTTADLDRFYRRLLEVGGPQGHPYAPSTIRRVHGIVRRVLVQGVRWGWLTHNPAIEASPPRVLRRTLAHHPPKTCSGSFGSPPPSIRSSPLSCSSRRRLARAEASCTASSFGPRWPPT